MSLFQTSDKQKTIVFQLLKAMLWNGFTQFDQENTEKIVF